jgi:hypothetical protein
MKDPAISAGILDLRFKYIDLCAEIMEFPFPVFCIPSRFLGQKQLVSYNCHLPAALSYPFYQLIQQREISHVDIFYKYNDSKTLVVTGF